MQEGEDRGTSTSAGFYATGVMQGS